MRVWLLTSVMLGGCIHDSLERCGDQLCPYTAVCMADRCVPLEALAACDGMPDGATCTTTILPSGVCRSGECILGACGNGVREPATEACDDGNQVGGDGCAADCGALDLCPPIGMTPHYSNRIGQLVTQNCHAYMASLSANRAIAVCGSQSLISSGPLEGPFVAVPELPNHAGDQFTFPVLTPDGDELWVLHHQIVGSMGNILSYEAWVPMADGHWAFSHLLGQLFPNGQGAVPSRGPLRRVFVSNNSTMSNDEYEVDAAGNARVVGSYLWTYFGASYVPAPNMIDDGLRATITTAGSSGGAAHVAYIDRPTLDDRFSPARESISFDVSTDVVVTAHCETAVFSGFGVIFGVRQVP